MLDPDDDIRRQQLERAAAASSDFLSAHDGIVDALGDAVVALEGAPEVQAALVQFSLRMAPQIAESRAQAEKGWLEVTDRLLEHDPDGA